MISLKKDVRIDDYEFKEYLSREEIDKKVKKLAGLLRREYKGSCPIFICLLNGAFIFAADLIREYANPCEMEFVKLQSYKGMGSSGEIDVKLPIYFDLEGRDVIVIEDIVDSGTTLKFFLELVRKKTPKSLKLVTLLSKPEARKYPVIVDYVGFEIPNDFVIGYGLDYDGRGRQLAAIYTLKS